MIYPGWPYAAKAVIQHDFDAAHLYIYLTFNYVMNQLLKPSLTKWHVFAATIEQTVSSTIWLDAYTLQLICPPIIGGNPRIECSYDGPGPTVWNPGDPSRETLETTFAKQWEPWIKILSLDITT